ncbi:MAG: DUF4198 domain-containing protein [Xenococcaceae cyanobacterium MO_207.B15]|nr:DUF4198 domain-containing protein [Xenococcaceae cyanobacterium MO_207.B15]
MKNSWSKWLYTATATLVTLLVGQSAVAHVIWFESVNDEQYEIIFGHPEENSPEPLEIEKFQEATAYDTNQNVIPSTTNFEDGNLFLNTDTQPSILTAFYDNGFWRENPDGSYDNIAQEEAEAINYENVSQFVKYAKGIFDEDVAFDQTFGLPLEIVPLENPLALEAGDTLPIQVYFQNELIDDPLVEYLGETISLDSNGIALIPIGSSGLEVIEASYTDSDSNNPSVSYAATLAADASADTSATVPEPLNLLGLVLILVSLPLVKKR